MNRQLFIGDIHACSNTFTALLAKLDFSKNDTLYLVGDYINRGPDSKGVIDKIIQLKKGGYNLIALRGNHEQMLLSNYEAETAKGWYSMGDEELLKSFEIESLKELPEKYIRFCEELSFYHEENELIIVHAGLNFEYENPFENKNDLLWIRDWYSSIDYDWLGQKFIIHGHTMQSKQETEAQFQQLETNRYLNIDCGAVMSKSKEYGLGYLCAFDFTNKKLYFQKNVETKNIF